MRAAIVWQSALGVVVLTAIAYGLGGVRRPPWRVAAAGLAMQFAIAALLLKLPPAQELFLLANRAVSAVQEATRAGTSFAFGYLGGGALPFAESYPGAAFVLTFQALPLILVMSALSALLFHWRVLPWIVRAFARALERTLGVGGAVGVAAAANVFVGMVEAPLLIRPYLRVLTRGELFMVMTCGMATVAGTVLVLYATILDPVIPNAIGHILIASLISAPAAVMVARLMLPEDAPPTAGGLDHRADSRSSMEAITRGTSDGVGLLLNVVAMLVVLVALVSLVNQILGLAPDVAGGALTLQRVLGWAMEPLAWLIGVPWSEAASAGALMGTKTVLNELIAYIDLAALPPETLSPRSRLLMTYALCGFANFGSLGILIGGLGAMAPERRAEVVALGPRSIVAGTLATCLTAAVVGILTPVSG